MEAARLADVRGIGLLNPAERAIPKSTSLTPQILMPGEQTRPRRNVSHETQFVIQASPGATWVIEGEAFPMEVGDLIVSPAGTTHHHFNGGAEPAIWLDSQDLSLRSFVGAETDEQDLLDSHHETFAKPAGYFAATQDRMKFSSVGGSPYRPPMRYPWSETFVTLQALKESGRGGDAFDGIHLSYTSPVDGGPTLPTFSCEIQLLTPGTQTASHRHNSTATYYVFRGEGRTEAAGERLQWATGDILVIPPWMPHRHENPSREDAILYSVDDWPAMAKMGFYRVGREADTP
jgi:gentisate 1,2-dioxygenase